MVQVQDLTRKIERLNSEHMILNAKYNETLTDLVQLRSSNHESLTQQIEKINQMHLENKNISCQAAREETEQYYKEQIATIRATANLDIQNKNQIHQNQINIAKHDIESLQVSLCIYIFIYISWKCLYILLDGANNNTKRKDNIV
jgi:hypothetical protein